MRRSNLKHSRQRLPIEKEIASHALSALGESARNDGCQKEHVMSFTLTISAFADGGSFPAKFTCEGANVSPELHWRDAPTNTKSIVLIVDDPDAPVGTFTHWVLFDIPADTKQMAEGEKTLGVAGKNDFGRAGYGGPCPPRGHGPHRYFFTLYALDIASLKLKAGADRRQVEAVLRGHVLAQAQYLGRYERK
jgi:hypothetical protein